MIFDYEYVDEAPRRASYEDIDLYGSAVLWGTLDAVYVDGERRTVPRRELGSWTTLKDGGIALNGMGAILYPGDWIEFMS